MLAGLQLVPQALVVRLFGAFAVYVVVETSTVVADTKIVTVEDCCKSSHSHHFSQVNQDMDLDASIK